MQEIRIVKEHWSVCSLDSHGVYYNYFNLTFFDNLDMTKNATISRRLSNLQKNNSVNKEYVFLR